MGSGRCGDGAGKRVVKLQQSVTGTPKKIIEIDSQPYQRLAQARMLPVVVFEPNHLQLLHGSPEIRRDYVDSLLERTVAGFGRVRRDYRRALFQRNTLLKSGRVSYGDMFVWNVRCSELGGAIAQARAEVIHQMEPIVTQLYQQIAGSTVPVQVTYYSRCRIDNYGSHMLKKLEGSLDQDVQRGYTSYGPHRDDIVLSLDGHPAREVASRGEVRTIVLALKVAEMRLLEERSSHSPLLLLDDVFSELDGARRKHLTEFLKDHQSFITTTDADIVVQHFMQRAHIIPL
jgi:DNA replication and repair protein RecF